MGSSPIGESILKGDDMLQTIFNVAATFMLLWLGIIWQKSSTANVIIKFLLIILAIYGIFVCLTSFGFIIKV